MQGDIGQGGTAIEGMAIDSRHSIGENNGLEAVATLEHTLWHPGLVGRPCDGAQRIAVIENVTIERSDARGQGGFAHTASIESLSANALNAGRQIGLCEGFAILEGVVSDVFERRREGGKLQLSAVSEAEPWMSVMPLGRAILSNDVQFENAS